METPPLRKVREAALGAGPHAGTQTSPQVPGKEDWRDGEHDDGEPTEDEALSIEPEDDPEVQNDVA